ncbi:MAG: hypothetical protein QG552_1120 [Thermodesulfobacteriota bacterium]|nr:hypothetical protein [Thermodesulfobacteriota bacterium]
MAGVRELDAGCWFIGFVGFVGFVEFIGFIGFVGLLGCWVYTPYCLLLTGLLGFQFQDWSRRGFFNSQLSIPWIFVIQLLEIAHE